MAIEEYYEALQRLKTGKTIVVPKGTLITNDAVSLEAGKSKSSIKRSREVFKELIAAIEAASNEQNEPKLIASDRLNKARVRVEKLKSEVAELQEKLDLSLARQVWLAKCLLESKEKLAQLTSEKITPITKWKKDKSEDQDKLF